MKLLLITILTFLGISSLTAQTTLTKDEILNIWTSSNTRNADRDSTNFTTDAESNTRINSLIDSLHQQGLDSIIIYIPSRRHGYITKKNSLSATCTVYCYVLWASGNQVNIRTINGECESNIAKTDSAGIFDYYNSNRKTILQEAVMPVIMRAERTKDNHIVYTTTTRSHEPYYSLYFINGNAFKTLYFSLSYLQDEESLFHEYNLNLRSIYLWRLIKETIGDNRD